MSSLSGTHHESADFLPDPLATDAMASAPADLAGADPADPEGPDRSHESAEAASANAGSAEADRGPRPDLALLERAKAGDRPAYGQIVVLYQDRLYNAILRLVGDRDEAQELTQEAFTRGLMKLDSFRGDASPYTWLFRIAVNLAISQLRKVRRNRVFSLDRPGFGSGARGGPGRTGSNGRYDADDSQASGLMDRMSHNGLGRDAPDEPSRRAEHRERDQQVLAALGRLDAEYRAVLVMRDVEGFDYQQMADVLGLPLGTLKSRLFRARLALRDELRSYLKDLKDSRDPRDSKGLRNK